MKKMRLQVGTLSLVLLPLLPLLLSGCSLFNDHSMDYLQTQPVAEIVLPADLKHLQIQEKLVVPAAAQPENLPDVFEVPRPLPLEVASMQPEQSLDDQQTWSADVNARLVTDGNGSPILRLDVEFPQAWAQVGKALKAQHIEVEDLDRSVGTYYVILKNAPEKSDGEGWFSERKEPLYEVKVNRARSGVYVALHKDADTLADNQFALAFLESLQPVIENPTTQAKPTTQFKSR